MIAIKKALLKVAHRIRDRAIDEAPYRTGALRKSITVHDEFEDKVIVSAGDGGAPYAPYVHEGSGIFGRHKRRYEIRPKEKKALYRKGARHPVKKVVQIGQKSKPFLLIAAKKTEPEVFYLNHVGYPKIEIEDQKNEKPPSGLIVLKEKCNI